MSYRKYGDLGEQKKTSQSQHYEVTEIQSIEHKQDLIRKAPVLCIDVYANWCNPCKQIAPNYAILAQKYSKEGKCMLVKENLQLGISKDFGITAVPTFLIFHYGAFVEQVTGGDLSELEKTLNKVLDMSNSQNTPNNSHNFNQNYSKQPTNHSNSSSNYQYKNNQAGFNIGNRHRY